MTGRKETGKGMKCKRLKGRKEMERRKKKGEEGNRKERTQEGGREGRRDLSSPLFCSLVFTTQHLMTSLCLISSALLPICCLI